MKKIINKIKILGVSILSLFLVSGTNLYASDSVSSLFPDVASESQADALALQNKLESSWNEGRSLIINEKAPTNSYNLHSTLSSNRISDDKTDLAEWSLVNIMDLNKDFLDSTSEKERSSFLKAFYSDERKANLEVGDFMSALLLSPDRSQAKVYWQKYDDSFFVMDLHKDQDENWHITGNGYSIN